jgi:TRAP-type C4-dicarboxylate transport system substrate-binding protein
LNAAGRSPEDDRAARRGGRAPRDRVAPAHHRDIEAARLPRGGPARPEATVVPARTKNTDRRDHGRMTMKTRVLTLALALSVLAGANAANAEVSWRFFGLVPPTHDHAKQVSAALAKVGERTSGEFTIRFVYYGETPFKGGDALTVLRDGQVEMTEWMPTFSVGTYPLLAAPEMPFIVPRYMPSTEGQKLISKAWQSKAMNDFVSKLLIEHKAKVLAQYYYEPASFWFADANVHTIADVKGKRIRVYNPEIQALAESMGAIPVSLGYQDVYPALQRNTLDAVITGVGSIRGAKWDEVLNSGIRAEFQYARSHVLINEDKWAELSAEQQKVLTEVMTELTTHMADYVPEAANTKYNELVAGGMKIEKISQDDYATLRQGAKDTIWPGWKTRVGAGAEELLADVLSAVE